MYLNLLYMNRHLTIVIGYFHGKDETPDVLMKRFLPLILQIFWENCSFYMSQSRIITGSVFKVL